MTGSRGTRTTSAKLSNVRTRLAVLTKPESSPGVSWAIIFSCLMLMLSLHWRTSASIETLKGFGGQSLHLLYPWSTNASVDTDASDANKSLGFLGLLWLSLFIEESHRIKPST